jgi:uncharacterized membrane protein YbhN (UPF0104 family)
LNPFIISLAKRALRALCIAVLAWLIAGLSLWLVMGNSGVGLLAGGLLAVLVFLLSLIFIGPPRPAGSGVTQ